MTNCDWYLAGTLKHPRMGWPVDFYRCKYGLWDNHGRCTSHAVGDGLSGESKPGQVFTNFEAMYYWLSAP